ncbi:MULTISPECIES: hypothetical protein [Bacillus]|uniref:Uncharacterized protein n=1 Tax=Bacillus subtilis TaxID=1423 RepID=A0AAP1DZU0_BACIU|nr:hypothetical protein [Bacillus subtilis]AIX09562.1 hypothetical protein OB04_03945 [Bacillus subtilis]KIN51476.1 hypothetical protein B4146_4243 [Bacillus subtilis]KZD88400.1 hypothetical protein B4122_4350 [Bacillus subtilis]MED3628721.1 hypothetical protein [Bacillus subtilis]OBA03495.1 hypothetical protein A9D36_12685 [Bacillus subtilis]
MNLLLIEMEPYKLSIELKDFNEKRENTKFICEIKYNSLNICLLLENICYTQSVLKIFENDLVELLNGKINNCILKDEKENFTISVKNSNESFEIEIILEVLGNRLSVLHFKQKADSYLVNLLKNNINDFLSVF